MHETSRNSQSELKLAHKILEGNFLYTLAIETNPIHNPIAFEFQL